MLICHKLYLQANQVFTSVSFATKDAVAIVITISLKISNIRWREELTDLSDLYTQLFVGTIKSSVSNWCYDFEKVLTT